jgi:hypothetical protein
MNTYCMAGIVAFVGSLAVIAADTPAAAALIIGVAAIIAAAILIAGNVR